MPFEFQRVRDYGEMGIVLEVSEEAKGEMDGAPIVNDLGRLVGITRVRWDEQEKREIAYGLPVRWLFDLQRGTLSSKLSDLRRLRDWDDWVAENWDVVSGMTRGESECRRRLADLTEKRQREQYQATETIQRSWWKRWLR